MFEKEVEIDIPGTPYANIEEGVLFMENLKRNGNFGLKDRGTSKDLSLFI